MSGMIAFGPNFCSHSNLNRQKNRAPGGALNDRQYSNQYAALSHSIPSMFPTKYGALCVSDSWKYPPYVALP